MLEELVNKKPSNLKSITPSGFFGKKENMIGSIENFLSEKEIVYLINFVANNDIWDKSETHKNENGTITYNANYWDGRVATTPSIIKKDPEIISTINNIVKRLKPKIDDFFKVDASPTSPALVRWLPGNFQLPHADKELHEGADAGKPNDFPWYDIATIIYLNDDYDGGELYFPNQDIQFKPKRGGAYFFPGDMNYIHGITEITSGIRYTCPFFWTILSHRSRDFND